MQGNHNLTREFQFLVIFHHRLTNLKHKFENVNLINRRWRNKTHTPSNIGISQSRLCYLNFLRSNSQQTNKLIFLSLLVFLKANLLPPHPTLGGRTNPYTHFMEAGFQVPTRNKCMGQFAPSYHALAPHHMQSN